MSVFRRISIPLLRFRTLQHPISKRTLCNFGNQNVNLSTQIHFQPANVAYNSIRLKTKKAKYDSDDEDEKFDLDGDTSLTKDSKVIKFNTTSMRADVILKSGLGVARNKIELLFYESKLRINGKKLTKKSVAVKPGDEVDIIKMVSPNNPEHLYVARVEVINTVPKEESITVTARRFKNLLIENYERDPYKGGGSEDND